MQALLHTLIPPKLLILSFLTPPLYIGSNRSHHVSCLSYFRTTYFITPLSGYHAPISPLHSNISASILSLVIYQLFRHLTCSYLTQPIFDNASLLLVIPFTSRIWKKGLSPHQTARLHPNPDISIGFFNALLSILYTILTAKDYSLINFHLIPQDERIITLAYLASLSFYMLLQRPLRPLSILVSPRERALHDVTSTTTWCALTTRHSLVCTWCALIARHLLVSTDRTISARQSLAQHCTL